jgi:DNA-binding MarR family transcriptional regulator
MDLKLPPKPRLKLKEQPPDQRMITVCPIRAATDRNLTPMQLRALLVYCSYTNKAGVAWVGLERIGKDLGVSTPRAHQLIKALDGKGYIKTLHKGYTGICANTRRVMFDPTLSAADAASISGELAPYQIKQQQEEQKAMEKKQAKRKAKPRAKLLESIEPGNQVINADRLNLSEPRCDDVRLADLQYHTSKAFAHIDADILALAIDSLGAALPTEANVEAAIERLMR